MERQERAPDASKILWTLVRRVSAEMRYEALFLASHEGGQARAHVGRMHVLPLLNFSSAIHPESAQSSRAYPAPQGCAWGAEGGTGEIRQAEERRVALKTRKIKPTATVRRKICTPRTRGFSLKNVRNASTVGRNLLLHFSPHEIRDADISIGEPQRTQKFPRSQGARGTD